MALHHRLGSSPDSELSEGSMSADDSLPDLSESWELRLERVRRSQARTDVDGMTRPPRDPVEREFLRGVGREGPFTEVPGPRDWPPEMSRGITDAERQEMLEMVSPEAIRSRLLQRRSLVVALLAGEDLLSQGVRPGGPEEMLSVLGLRAPLPSLTPQEVVAWREMDPRHDELYYAYLRDQDTSAE